MKKILFLAAAVLLLSCGFADAQDASDIVKKSRDKFRMVKSEIEEADISVKYDGGRVEQKTYTRWIHFDPAGEDKVTIVFSAPANDKGLGLLTWRHRQGEDDQWLKLPSMKQVRRVSTSDQTKYFAGTDITYEDSRQLIGERIDDFNYQILKKEGEATIIESKPKAEAQSIYGKRILMIDGKLAVVRVEYYSPEGNLVKTQQNSSIVQEKGCWRVNEAKMENILLKRSTIFRITKRQLDCDVPASVFTKTFLEEKSR